MLHLSGFEERCITRRSALAALSGNVDLDYAGANGKVSDEAAPMSSCATWGAGRSGSHAEFTYVWIRPRSRGAAAMPTARWRDRGVSFAHAALELDGRFIAPHDVGRRKIT